MTFVVMACAVVGIAAAEQRAAQGTFQLSSADVKTTFAQTQVANTFGCSGGNVSPQLSWTGAPAGTKSFAITIYDPDAPTGSGWWHWVAVNIPASVTQLASGASPGKMPAGTVETRTDFGKPGYGGPCPPPGETHHYIFTIYALKVDKLDLDAQASGAMAGFMIRSNSLGSATFTVMFKR
ncbi:MAG TPA: YbhB/YbcL family Raf kinase inhibitor-like protein [Vicinamibacterales bacterium]|nr:YbhB/YbcL family Raf kinase inhibitor-like protein [Vicinamibacterales bacterium]